MSDDKAGQASICWKCQAAIIVPAVSPLRCGQPNTWVGKILGTALVSVGIIAALDNQLSSIGLLISGAIVLSLNAIHCSIWEIAARSHELQRLESGKQG